MHIRAVLFDLDNTLFDHRASARAGLEAFLRHLQATSSADLASSWFEIEQRSYDRFLLKEISFQEQRRERLRQFLPMIGLTGPLDEGQLDDLFVTYLQSYERAWTAFRDAAPVLQELRASGITVGVITNGNHHQQSAKIEKIGLGPLLDGVFSSESTGYAKPAPEAFLIPCESMGISPAETLYVGDDYATDIAGARSAGLQALHLDRPAGRGEGKIRSLTELVPLREYPNLEQTDDMKSARARLKDQSFEASCDSQLSSPLCADLAR
ncbi:HAD family hydrolase [Arthrobacter sp. KFRI-F3372]|uniref:HAD family hydrolase n=1 Tax=Pseudarthrobacter oxydans TaxID=1671 RepID=UPI0027A3B30C|nr:HAD family hydrolase [Arthrobacter sp. KFRI-F3372]